MNHEEAIPNHEAQLASIETAVVNNFPGFSPDRSRILDMSSGERGILEFYQEGKDRTKDPMIYILLKRPEGLTSYAHHLPPPEGRISLIGATSYDIDEKGQEVPWNESDIDLMLAKMKIFTDGIELNDELLDQISTFSPRSNDLVTFRQRLADNHSPNLEQPSDEYEAINWNDVYPELRGVYEEEIEAILMSTPHQVFGGLRVRNLAGSYPNLTQLIVEENIKKGHALPGLLGLDNPFQALDDVRSGTALGKRIVKAELHRLDAIEGILATRNPRLPVPQSS